MPAGLDGNPEPLVTPARDALLDVVSAKIGVRGPGRILVGVDGRPGSGKSTFADEIAARLRRRGRTVVRSTTDAFHRPIAERQRQGPDSAVGFVEESHQVDVIVDELLGPFRRGEKRVRTSAFDAPSDAARDDFAEVPADAVLVFDGLFLHRAPLVSWWHLSVLLEADRRCDVAWLAFLEGDLPDDPTARADALDERLHRARWPRYRDGWRRYLADADPAQTATIVVGNDDLAAPVIVSERAPTARRTARVLLVDDHERILLFRGIDRSRPDLPPWWFTVGGALDQGEDPRDAAVREVAEETGLVVDDVGDVVLTRSFTWDFEGQELAQDEEYFFVRVPAFELSTGGWTEVEAATIESHRWWTVEELRRTTEAVFPEGLADLLDRLLTGAGPD